MPRSLLKDVLVGLGQLNSLAVPSLATFVLVPEQALRAATATNVNANAFINFLSVDQKFKTLR